MSDWVLVILILVLLVLIAALVLTLVLRQPAPQDKRMSAGNPLAVIPPAEKPRITIRKNAVSQSKFRRKYILGNPRLIQPQLAPAPPPQVHTVAATPQSVPSIQMVAFEPEANGNGTGPKIKRREIKIEFDAICKVTGMPIRECPCSACQTLRSNAGS